MNTPSTSNSRKLHGFVAILIVLFFVFIFSVSMFIANIGRAEGTHQGYITAVETTGIIFSVDSVYVKTDLATTQEDTYCVMDPEVRDQLEDAAKEKRAVSLKFKNDLIVWAWECSPAAWSIIVGVE